MSVPYYTPYFQFTGCFGVVTRPSRNLSLATGKFRAAGHVALADAVLKVSQSAQALEKELKEATMGAGYYSPRIVVLEYAPYSTSPPAELDWFDNVGRDSRVDGEPYNGKVANRFYSTGGTRKIEYVVQENHWYWGQITSVKESGMLAPWNTYLDACEKNLRLMGKGSVADKVAAIHDELIALTPSVISVTGATSVDVALNDYTSDYTKQRFPGGTERIRLLDNTVIPA